jgi:hypothetical protein
MKNSIKSKNWIFLFSFINIIIKHILKILKNLIYSEA